MCIPICSKNHPTLITTCNLSEKIQKPSPSSTIQNYFWYLQIQQNVIMDPLSKMKWRLNNTLDASMHVSLCEIIATNIDWLVIFREWKNIQDKHILTLDWLLTNVQDDNSLSCFFFFALKKNSFLILSLILSIDYMFDILNQRAGCKC